MKALPIIASVQTTEVVHCRKAFALRLEHISGWSLVYSGDTRPCDSIVKLGQVNETEGVVDLPVITRSSIKFIYQGGNGSHSRSYIRGEGWSGCTSNFASDVFACEEHH
jgi:hypothetical protein